MHSLQLPVLHTIISLPLPLALHTYTLRQSPLPRTPPHTTRRCPARPVLRARAGVLCTGRSPGAASGARERGRCSAPGRVADPCAFDGDSLRGTVRLMGCMYAAHLNSILPLLRRATYITLSVSLNVGWPRARRFAAYFARHPTLRLNAPHTSRTDPCDTPFTLSLQLPLQYYTRHHPPLLSSLLTPRVSTLAITYPCA